MNAPSGNSMNRCGCGLRDGGIRVRFVETRGLNLVSKFRLIKICPEEFCTVGRFIISPGIGMTESMRVRWVGNVGEMRSPYIWYWLVYLKGTDVSEDRSKLNDNIKEVLCELGCESVDCGSGWGRFRDHFTTVMIPEVPDIFGEFLECLWVLIQQEGLLRLL